MSNDLTIPETIILRKLREAVRNNPNLSKYTVIVLAIRYLESGRSMRSALYCIMSDMDKLRNYPRIAKFLRRAIDSCLASDRIKEANSRVNNGRGSSVARSLINHLENLELDEAKSVWLNDADKVRQYPLLYDTIRNQTALGCRLHNDNHCLTCKKY